MICQQLFIVLNRLPSNTVIGMNLEYPLDPQFHAYKHIEIIRTKESKIIVIGWNSSQDDYGGFIIHKTRNNEDLLDMKRLLIEVEPQPTYPKIKEKIVGVLGNFHPKESIYGYGILGFHRFLQGYYMTYVSEIEACAKIGRHRVYRIKDTRILPLFDLQSYRRTKKNEEKYFEILNEFKPQHFYVSHTYDLTNSLAINMIRNSRSLFFAGEQKPRREEESQRKKGVGSGEQKILESCEMFLFNYEILREFGSVIKNKKFVMLATHGYCKHINIERKGTQFNIIVIARRSRHHAGTRYIKRGIDPFGFVANFVEVEQIVVNYTSSQDTRPVCSSFLQVRGSVPTYWMQRPSIHIPKPVIEVRADDYIYLATRKHFSDLVRRYGCVVYAVNLMKTKEKNPRECVLSGEYQRAVEFINREDLRGGNEVHYLEVDMKYHLRLDKKMFVSKIKTIAYYSVLRTGLFLCLNRSNSAHQQFLEFQNGVVRANCVDCLDRTNSFQQLVGETALAMQLARLMREPLTLDDLALPDRTLDEYSRLYEEMGDLISIQYGSSLAHKQKIQKSSESRFEFLIAITRHVNNNWNDYDRQEQLDVFLGYKPDPDGPQIWEFKPSIEHCVDTSLREFQNGNWYLPALQEFTRAHHIEEFKSINNSESFERNLPKIENFKKEDLMSKFNAEVISALINDKEVIPKYQFFVVPKTIHEKKFWRERNPPSKKPETLKDELSYCYNKFEFSSELSPEKKKAQCASIPKTMPKFKSQGPVQITRNKLPSRSFKPSLSFYMEDKNHIYRNAERAFENDPFDENEVRILEKYMAGELIDDDEIEEMVEEYLAEVSKDVEHDWPTEYDIERELRQLGVALKNKNYLNPSGIDENKGSSEFNFSRAKKKTLAESENVLESLKTERKQEKMKENKILILEQIMKKNFSHGNIKKIEEI